MQSLLFFRKYNLKGLEVKAGECEVNQPDGGHLLVTPTPSAGEKMPNQQPKVGWALHPVKVNTCATSPPRFVEINASEEYLQPETQKVIRRKEGHQ